MVLFSQSGSVVEILSITEFTCKQELQMLSSVAIYCQVTMIVMMFKGAVVAIVKNVRQLDS